MKKALCLVVCLVMAAVSYTVSASEDPKIAELRQATQAKYLELKKQAAALLKEPIDVPEPPSGDVSCPDEKKADQDAKQLKSFRESFRAPEGPLCNQMLGLQKELQLMGAAPDYTMEGALTDRLGQKAQTLIKTYGRDIEKLAAISAVALQTIQDIQLLSGSDSTRDKDLMEAVSAMYAAAVEKLFRMLTEEHDYGTVQPILDAAKAGLLLSGNSGVDTDSLLTRLQNALRFELKIVYRIHLPIDHWEEQATLQVAPVSVDNLTRLEGSGTGSLTSYINDKVPDAYFEAPAFSVQAALSDFLPCQGTVKLSLSPFYPASATLTLPDDEEPLVAPSPLMQLGWEMAQTERLGEGGYVYPLTLRNKNEVAVDESINSDHTAALKTELQITLTHKPGK